MKSKFRERTLNKNAIYVYNHNVPLLSIQILFTDYNFKIK